MKKWKKLAAALTVGLLLASCGAAADPPQTGDGTLSVCASFDTMADFARKVGGDRVSVTSLVPAGTEPHEWEPSAKDIARLEGTDLLILNGAGLEHWADGVIPTLSNADLVVVDASQGILLNEGHGHGLHEDEDHELAVDPHVWMDPKNAMQQAAAICDALIAIDPEGDAYYRQSFANLTSQFLELDEEYHRLLETLPRKEIVVAHEAYGYLCQAYGLEQVAAQGLSPEGEPDPAQMAQVIDYCRENGVKVIFFETTASPKIAEAIARETGAATAVLSPLESLGEGEDYFSVMRQNLKELEAALS